MNALRLEEGTFLVFLAVIIGLLGGFGAIGFRLLIEFLQSLTIGAGSDGILAAVAQLPWYAILLIPALGGLVYGPLVHFFAPEAKGHGVPEVMEAVALHGGRIRPRVVGIKAFASALCIATGGAVGREGPIVQIGSAIGSALGQVLHVRKTQLRVLVACGAAAGIAATFNAPIAGVLFAIELILGSYAIITLTPIIISSVTATIVCHAFPAITGGDVRAFEIPFAFRLVSAWEVPLYFGLGLLAAVVAWAFMRTLFFSEDVFEWLPIPAWATAPLGGLILGAGYLLMPGLLGGIHPWGVGYESIEMAMRGDLVWTVLLALVGIKILATSLTLGSGGSGGIFAPSLFLGAMAGGAFGMLVGQLFPGVTAQPGAYALVGMGAVVAGTTHAPITAILIIFELTGDYQIILPIMISSVLANLVVTRFQRDSIYTMKLTRAGVKLNQGVETTIIGRARVKDVMMEEAPTVLENETLNHVLPHFLKNHVTQVFVLDDAGMYRGVIDINDVISLITESRLQGAFIASDVMEENIPTVSPDESLVHVFEKFGGCQLSELPVVQTTGEGAGKFRGRVARQSVFLFYNREVLRQRALGLKFVQEGEEDKGADYVWMPPDHEVKVVPTPPSMVGRTLKELDLRARFDVNVVAIRSHRYDPSTDSVPSPDRVLRRRDILVVVGGHDAIESMLRSNGA
jgi:CIC family chloride channel protein